MLEVVGRAANDPSVSTITDKDLTRPLFSKCESTNRCFQPVEGPSRGLLRDCTTSPINRFAALVWDNISPARTNVSHEGNY